MSSKKFLSNQNDSNRNRKIIIGIIVILVIAAIVVGLYFLIKNAIKKKMVDVVTNAGNIVIDVVNELNKPIDKPMKNLDFIIRGVKGDELFSISALDEAENITILLDETVASIENTPIYIPTVPSGTKTIIFRFLNDQSGRDIVLEEFKLNGVDIRPLLIGRENNLPSVINGRFLWGGDYLFDVSHII